MALNNFVLLSEAVKITPLMTASGSAGGVATNDYYPATGSFLDMSDFETVMFQIDLRDLADAIDVEVYQSTTSGSTGTPKAITGAAKTDIAATDDGEMITIEVGADQLDINNDYRYVTLKVSGVSGSNWIDLHALQFKPGLQAVTQPATYTHQIVVV
jgi:hypothetical protein